MFTGIVQSLGRVVDISRQDGDISLTVNAPGFGNRAAGDSVAVNGVCLTLVDDGEDLRFDVSVETVSRTLVGEYEPGRVVNLESALTLNAPLGGHLVTGHVDGTARIVSTSRSARSTVFRFSAQREFARFIAEKGSIALDGISLTVNDVHDNRYTVEFEVNIVPHTLAHTNLSALSQGDRVHLEVDPVARYLDRLCQQGRAPAS